MNDVIFHKGLSIFGVDGKLSRPQCTETCNFHSKMNRNNVVFPRASHLFSTTGSLNSALVRQSCAKLLAQVWKKDSARLYIDLFDNSSGHVCDFVRALLVLLLWIRGKNGNGKIPTVNGQECDFEL